MQVVSLPDEAISEPVCLMIGNYDGVHLGHQAIIKRGRELAARDGLKTAVLSFAPHPLKVLAPDKAPLLLHTPAQKEALLARHEVDYYLIRHFSKDFSKLSPRAFVERLRERVDFKHVLIGFNFHFGHKRAGNPEVLAELGRELGFSVEVTSAQQSGGETISSSRIRKLVAEGQLEEAAALLSRPYFLEGQVEPGAGLGTAQLKTPTANLKIHNELLPRFGVYASWVRADGVWRRAISNMGAAPTVDRGRPLLESKLFDFEGNLYGKHIVVTLGAFLRPETRFDNLDALKEQIRQDVARRLDLPDRDPPQFDIL